MGFGRTSEVLGESASLAIRGALGATLSGRTPRDLGGAPASIRPERYGAPPVRLVVARCEVTYTGRLTAYLPEAIRLLVFKADGSVLVHADSSGL